MRRISVYGGWILLAAAGCQPGTAGDAQGEAPQAAESTSLDLVQSAARRAPEPGRWTPADDRIIAPVWVGNDDHGTLYAPLWRGATDAIEDLVWSPPDHDCRQIKGTVRIDWDRAANTVHVMLKYRGLPVSPVVHRTEGVDWWPDPFHTAPQNIEVGSYRFWIISLGVSHTAQFYYDASTLLLRGSEFDFPGGQPAGTIPITVPIFKISASQRMRPDADGNLFHDYTIPYDHLTTEEGAYSFAWANFVPLDLCMSLPWEPLRSQLRPYFSPWQPTSVRVSFQQLLHENIAFDTTIDDYTNPETETHGQNPYVESGVDFIGNSVGFPGGVPNGWRQSIPSAIGAVAPVIRAIDGGNGLGCQSFVNDPMVTAPRYCEMSGAAGGAP